MTELGYWLPNREDALLEALAGLYARSGEPAEVTAAMRLAQRIEGFDIDGRGASKRNRH